MRITFLGHVGAFVETRGGSVLCDPWFTPAYFGSWFPFPRNDGLDPAPFSRPDYLYISHLHRDHFDPEWLAAHVDRSTTVLLPGFRGPFLERELRTLGFERFVHTRNGEPCDLDGLRVTILAFDAPADGPLGDSLLVVDDGTARLLNQNDARPGARNTAQTGGYRNIDVALSRLFHVKHTAIEGRLEAFNVLSTLNYDQYVGVLASPLFGHPVTAFPTRRMQLAAVVRF